MPVHNALPYLDMAIKSVLRQTFADFEFVILDDASTDGSSDRLRRWAVRDSRIRLLRVDRNLGPVGSSNMVANEAHSELVARMDADDVSHPERFSKQLEVFSSDSGVGVVASLSDVIDANGRRLRGPEKWRLARNSVMVPFAHGAIMYRRTLFETVGGYRNGCEYWEDQDLITRMVKASKAIVISTSLYTVRQTASSTRVTSEQTRLEQALNRMYRCMDRVARGQPYEDLLTDKGPDTSKMDPRVFIAMGSTMLWSGARPRLFRRTLERGKLRANSISAIAIMWTAWASVSPSTLRGFSRLLLKLRNFLSSIGADKLIRWTPPSRGGIFR